MSSWSLQLKWSEHWVKQHSTFAAVCARWTARLCIEAAIHFLVFLTTYCPIKKAYAKIKQGLQRIRARSWDMVVAASGAATVSFTAAFFADTDF